MPLVFRVEGFEVEGFSLGLRVEGLGLRVEGLWGEGLGFRASIWELQLEAIK